MVFFFVIVLTVLAVALLVAAAVSKKNRKRFVLAAVLVLLFAFWRAVTSSGFLNGLVALAGSIAIVGGLAYWFFHMIDSKKDERSGSGAKLLSGKRGVLGKVGVAVTPLRPTGQADIDGSRLVVSTEGEYIAAGSYVRVVAKDRKQYFVRLAEPSEFIDSVMSDSGV